jgi:hypothetical protein
MTPGPTEQDAEQIQNYLRLIVNDLATGYEQGFQIPTASCPGGTELTTCFFYLHSFVGRLIRVALVAVICDHPAMCKIAGFTDKNHLSAPDTKCTVSQSDLFSDAALRNGKYEKLTGYFTNKLQSFPYAMVKCIACVAMHGETLAQMMSASNSLPSMESDGPN